MDQIIGQGAPAGPAGGSAGGAAAIVDATDQTFAQEVLEASMTVPVIVDFWAPWCGPCKQLGPILEKIVTEAAGAVKLVKVDIDQSPGIAGQLRVQSIPAVFAFFQGRPVDAFQGALPESQIKEFIQNLARMAGKEIGPSPIEAAMEQATAAFDAESYDQAAAIYGQVLQHEPENVTAAAKLATSYIKLGEVEAAGEILGNLPDSADNDADVVSARAALSFAEKADEAAQKLGTLEAQVAENPNDHQARLDLADAQAGIGQNEAAIDNLLHIVSIDRGWNDDAARLQLLKLFEALGPKDPLVNDGRMRLSSILFS